MWYGIPVLPLALVWVVSQFVVISGIQMGWVAVENLAFCVFSVCEMVV